MSDNIENKNQDGASEAFEKSNPVESSEEYLKLDTLAEPQADKSVGKKTLTRQSIFAIVLGAVAIVLVLVYFLIISPIIADRSKTETKIPELLDGEVLGTNNQIMMFEHLERANIQSIDVHNDYGEFTFYRADDGEFRIKGCEYATYDLTLFSSLVVSSGYPLSMERIAMHCEDFSKYGLDGDNLPYFTVTSTEGNSHTVIIGDAIPSNAGYYVRYKGRDAVYVLESSLKNTILAPLTSMITPILTYPVSQNEYGYIEEFYLLKNGELFVSVETMDENEKQQNASISTYKMTYPGNYVPSSTNYDTLLRTFVSFSGTSTVEVGRDGEDIPEETRKKYGLDEPAYQIFFEYDGVKNMVDFSELIDGSYYYAYSYLYNLIGIVPADTVPFLEWELITYVDRPLFQMNINDVESIQIDSPEYGETFLLSGDGTELQVKVKSSGASIENIKNFRQFYIVMLNLSMENYAEETDISKLDCILTMKVTTRAGKTFEYKFYPYSTRRCFYTVNGEGEFYIIRDMVDKVISDARRVVNGETVNADAKN